MKPSEWTDGLSHIDPDLVETYITEKDRLATRKAQKKVLGRIGLCAACLIVLFALGMFAKEHMQPLLRKPAEDPTATQPDINDKSRMELGIYVDNMLYLRDSNASHTATAENIGAYIGLAALDGETTTDICVYQYVSESEETEQVILSYDGVYYVYRFYTYMIPSSWTAGQIVWDGITAEYFWTVYNDELYLMCDSADYSLGRIPGSDRYGYLQMNGAYCCLVDVKTGKVSDPLATLENDVLDYLSEVCFSPDGRYALISYSHGTVLELLNCETGNRIPLPYKNDLYAVSGYFVDSNRILIISTEQDADAQITYQLSYYDISAKKQTQIDGSYSAKDPNADHFLAMIAGPFAYTATDGKLTILDIRTFEQIVYPLNISEIDSVSYYASDCVYARAGKVHYLLKTDGSMQIVSE